MDTVIVRAPESGAIVSDVHPRGAIEAAQYPFLGNPDIVGGVFGFIDDVNGWSVNWPLALVLIAVTLAAVGGATAWAVRGRSSLRA